MQRGLKILILLGFAVVLAGILCVGALLLVSGGNPVDFVQTQLIRLSLASREAELNQPLSGDTTPVRFVVNFGDTPRAIAQRLVEQNLIRDAGLFVDYVRVSNLDVQLEAGTYFLTQAQSLVDIAQALTDSRNSQIVFSIIPGWRIEEVAAAIDSNRLFGFTGAEFLQVVGRGSVIDPVFAAYVGLPSGASLEGFLFPETYSLPPQITAAELRDVILEEFTTRVTPDLVSSAAAQSLSLYQAVTIASIVQRESVRTDENPLIASVYRNRLNIGMKLDADPTVQYAIGYSGGTWWPQITQADYSRVVSPYNTYLNTGLPPGPIANPSLSAIQAAINPEPSPYYFFRAECDGSGYHRFAVTFEEHLANGCS